MKKNRSQGAVLMVAGVAALNLVYLWDMILQKYEGMILLGTWAWLGIVIANIVIVASLWMMVGQQEHPEGEGGGEQAEP